MFLVCCEYLELIFKVSVVAVQQHLPLFTQGSQFQEAQNPARPSAVPALTPDLSFVEAVAYLVGQKAWLVSGLGGKLLLVCNHSHSSVWSSHDFIPQSSTSILQRQLHLFLLKLKFDYLIIWNRFQIFNMTVGKGEEENLDFPWMMVFLLPEGGPAHQSGLCQGDVVLQLNGLPVETWKCIDLAHAIRSPSLFSLFKLVHSVLSEPKLELRC